MTRLDARPWPNMDGKVDFDLDGDTQVIIEVLEKDGAIHLNIPWLPAGPLVISLNDDQVLRIEDEGARITALAHGIQDGSCAECGEGAGHGELVSQRETEVHKFCLKAVS